MKSLESATFNNENGTLTLTFSEDITKLSRRRPYIVKWDTHADPIKNPTFHFVEIYSSDPIPSECGAADFIGIHAPMTFTTANHTILFLGDANTLYYPSPAEGQTMTIGAFRGYFSLNDGLWAGEPIPGQNGINTFVLNFDGGETVITNTKSASPTNSTWYSIDGRKLPGKPTQKGIYIVNGQKRVVK